MTIEDRIRESEQKFDQLENQKQEILAEQQRLQGEWRALNAVLADEESYGKAKVNKKATVIEAVPEKEG